MASIGDVAAHHGVPAHVLRHWEDAGVLVPRRTAGGHRDYGPEHDAQISLVQCAKVAGMSLEQIRVLLHGEPGRRQEVLRRQAARLERRARELGAAQRLVQHALTCTASAAEGCEECATPHRSFGFPGASSGREPAERATAGPAQAPERASAG